MKVITSIKPKHLSYGDTIGIVAPAGPGKRENITAGVEYLTKQGFNVCLGKSVEESWGYLAGNDNIRLEDIHNMFASPDIAGIVCLRGGYGTMRILTALDYKLIKANPKVFVGYSDITALHLSIGQKTGLVTFHGPMVASDFGKGVTDYTWDAFIRSVAVPAPLGLMANPSIVSSPVFITSGRAKGCLTGGNLSVIAATLGTPYEIDTKGKILCIEDVGEAPYRIDRLLTQLLLANKLQNAAGLVLDVFFDCAIQGDYASFTLEEVLRERLGNLNIPVLYQLYFGHTKDKVTLPFGVIAELSSDIGGLNIIEAATI